MEKGRFAGWPVENDGPGASGPESNSTTKRKGRKEPDSPRPEVSHEPKAENPERPEAKKVSRALTDFIIERDSGDGARSNHEQAKKRPEEAEPVAAKVSPDQLEPSANGRPEADDDDEDEVDEEEGTRPAEHTGAPEHEHAYDDSKWPEHLVPLELEPGQLNGGEVILWRHDDEPRAEEPVHAVFEQESVAEAEEPEPELVPVAAEMPQLQLEQPGPSHTHEAATPEEPRAAAGFGEGEPPIEGSEGVASAEEFEPPAEPEASMVPLDGARRLDPAEAYRQYMVRDAAERVTADSAYTEPMVTRRAAEDEAYYAARRAQGSGFVTGLLVAGLWARHRGKKLRRQFNERFNKQEKQLKQAREDQRFYAAEQSKKQDEHNRQLSAVQNRLAGTERQLQQQELASRQTEQMLQRQERAGQQAEQVKTQAMQRQEASTGERLEVPPDHRLETSAWHTIEVDARTGKPVERPTFTYGREYYHERAQEAIPADKRSAVAGEVAIAGVAAADSHGGSNSNAAGQGGATLLPPNIPSATTQGAPRSSAQAKLQAARDSITKPTAAGPIWPYILALIVIVICLAVLL